MKNGFTIVEVLVATAIMGIVSIGLIGIINNNFRQISRATAKLESLDVQNSIRSVLTSESMCLENLKSQVINISAPNTSYPIETINIYDPAGAVLENIATVNKKTSTTSQVMVTNMTLSDIKKINNNEGYMKLNVWMKGEVGDTDFTFKPVSYNMLLFKTDPTNKITYCSLAPAISAQLSQILASVQPFTTSACINSRNTSLQSLTATCGTGYKLLNCFGAPGDQTETDEGFAVTPDYTTNSCKIEFQNVACGDTSRPNSLQRQFVTAYCFLESTN